MALTGTETLYVLGQNPTGVPAASEFQTTTLAIAALADAANNPAVINTAISTAGAGTLTAAGIVGGIITRTGPSAAFSDATATAVQIVAALTAYVAEMSFYLEVRNTTAFAQTITAGVGVTLTGNAVVPANSSGLYLVTIDSATAVTMLSVAVESLAGTAPIASTTLSTVGAGTITAAGIAGGVTNRTGSQSGTPFTDTTDTGTNLSAAVPNVRIGQSFEYTYKNTTDAVATITGGVGVTVSVITTVGANSFARFLVTCTAANTYTMVGLFSGVLDGAGVTYARGGLTVTGAVSATTTVTATTNLVSTAYHIRSVGNALTAAGTDRATSLALTKAVNNITTAAASTGVTLPVGQIGMEITIANNGAETVQVYAAASETINGTAGATGVTLAATKFAKYWFTAANTWISVTIN